MRPEDLKEEISIELELIETVVHEPLSLKTDLENREPTVREKPRPAPFWRNSITA